MNKRGLSPIIATILLIAFAVAIGAMIMTWTATLVQESTKCADLPEDIISPDAFCKNAEVIIPRIKVDDGYTVCQEHSINLDSLATC